MRETQKAPPQQDRIEVALLRSIEATVLRIEALLTDIRDRSRAPEGR